MSEPTCTCLGLPMGPGQTCDAHQLPAAPACTCPRSYMRQRGHHPACPLADDLAAGPTAVEATAQDRRWPLEKEGE